MYLRLDALRPEHPPVPRCHELRSHSVHWRCASAFGSKGHWGWVALHDGSGVGGGEATECARSLLTKSTIQLGKTWGNAVKACSGSDCSISRVALWEEELD
jgi:hypothetical protein